MNVDHALSAGNRPNKAFFTSEAGEVYGMHRRAQDDSSTSTIATAERGGEETREISYWLVDSDLSFSTAAPTESISVPQHSVSERQMPIPDHQRAPTLPEKTEVSKLSPIHIDLYPPNGISEKENEENWMQYYILSPTIVTVKPSIKLKWLALLLMTCFALLSGMDGKKYCQKSHINDDYQEHQQCAALFMNKVFPAGAVTIFCSILALGEISRPGETSVHLIGLPAVVALVAWSYSLLQLMLFSHPIPRASSSSIGGWNFSTSSEYSGFSPTETASIKQQQEESLYFFQSPSLESSLYCINELGEIGANANLYHAAWISLFVSMALSHQYLYPLFLLSCCRSYLFWKEQRVTRRYFFRHRERIRSWLAVLISCLIVMSSSSLIWTSVLRDECTHSYAIVRQWEEMQNAMGDDDYDDNDDFLSDGRTVQDDDIAAKTKVSILAIHPRICPSTELGMIMGASGAFVALITIIIHSSSHKMSSDGIPLKPTVPLLKLETFLCIGVVLTFGYGSMFLTGSYQGGLAQNVGNLYYSTWVAFVVSVRILIGCVEELFSNGADNSDIPEGDTSSSDGEDSISDMEKNPTDYVKEIGQSVQRGQSPRKDSLSIKGDKNRRRIFSLQAVGRKMSYHELQDKARATTKNWSEDRKAAIKRWCGIALFSTICHGAAFDAAEQYYYTNHGALLESRFVTLQLLNGICLSQRYAMLAPLCVTLLSMTVGFMHIHDNIYNMINGTMIGVACSLTAFLLNVSQILIAQHSDKSLTLNHLGEVVSANLYYFTWASVITAGLNFSKYLQAAFRVKPKSTTFALWFGMVKVGLIIMGASSHLWLEIKASCDAKAEYSSSLDEGSRGYCWRTRFAVHSGLAATGLSIVVCTCLLCHFRYTLVMQCAMSLALVGLFVLGTGTITGMGGPAEKVGDLYYSTWFAFVVSLFLAGDCFREIGDKLLVERVDEMTRTTSSSVVESESTYPSASSHAIRYT